ncbi:FxSxx-COOH cyclophane-containing RiPP peptide [Streptomyces sp. NPDC052042]|uniref:FxSxx-COOH cyclophane-containing RiPP peptide n=1 Tax=Streptomyces sp. NPDC052042 TaxID=3365683 RepID=UPI0037D387F4
MNEPTGRGTPVAGAPDTMSGATAGTMTGGASDDTSDRDADVVPGGPGPLPDLLELDLAALRTLDHPVLREVVEELRGRAGQPRETLWGFTSSF